MPRDLLEDIESQPRDLLEDTETITPEIVETKPTSNLGGVLTGLGLGGGAVAGAGYGIKKGYEFFRQPAVRTERKAILGQLEPMQKELGISGTELTYIPRRLSELKETTQREARYSLSNARNQAQQTSQALKNSLNLFDETVLALNIEDLSKSIVNNYPQFLKNASEGYSAGLEAISGYFEQVGKPINSLNFERDILDKTINMARKGGILEEQITPLLSLKQTITPKVSSITGLLAEETPMSFSQAKSYISNAINQDPYSPVSTMLRKNWGEFLEQNAPDEIRQTLSQMNKQFKTFAEARTVMNKIVNPRTGEFNTKALNKYLYNYTKAKTDEGIVELMRLLGEGSELVTPIKGVKGGFAALTKAKIQRGEIIGAMRKVPISSKEELAQLEQQISAKINKIQAMRGKSTELLSRLAVTEEKLSSRNLAKALTRLFGLGKKTIPFLAIIPQITDAVNYSKDPLGYTAALEGGMSLDELQKARRKYQEGTMSEEEKIRLGLVI